MKSIQEAPILYFSFIALHLLIGHFGSTFIYKLRYAKNPFALYKKNNNSLHTRLSKLISILSICWIMSIVIFVFSHPSRTTFILKPLIQLSPHWGFLIGSIGLIGMFISQIGMNEAFRIGQDESSASNQNHLKQSGIHSYSRNPIYVFSSLALIGMSLWSINVLTLTPLFLILMCIHGLVIAEEKFLKRQFNQAYEQYCANVPRYFSLRK